jgi:tetratricopeptide (TPR) repeat protein
MSEAEPALCELVELLIAARDQGDVDAAALAMIEEHVAACSACREVAAGTARLDAVTAFRLSDPADYRLGKEIARGGMGRIVAARDLRIGRDVAVKELVGATPGLIARFEREARLTAQLQHPGIVSIYEIGRWPEGTPFYSMRLVEGVTLKAKLAAAPTFEKRLELVPAVIAATEAVAFAHANHVIHRDLSPTNILVGDYGDTVVIDWGLAKDISSDDDEEIDVGPYRERPASDSITAVGSVIGTAAYMPPEQAEGAAVDARADVYALGAILYEVLAGRPPYSAKHAEQVLDEVRAGPPRSIESLVPQVPVDLASIVTKSMRRDPAARYESAKSLADDLRRFEAGQLVGARQYSIGQLIARWLRRHRTVVRITGAALVVMVVVSLMGLNRIVREQARTEDALQLAEHRRLEAEELVSFMLVDLSAKLCGQELLEDVAKKVADYYRARGASTKLATALEILGEAHLAHDRIAAALDDMTEAVHIRGEVVERDPTASSLSLYLAARDKLGLFLQQAHRPDQARAEFQAAVSAGERFYNRFPSREARERLCWAHDRLTNALLESGDLGGARDQHARASLLTDEVLLDHPKPVDWYFALDMHVEYSKRMFDLDPGVAFAELATAAAIAARIPGLDPTTIGDLSSAEGLRALVAQYRSQRDDERSALQDDRIGPPGACSADNQAYVSAVGHYYMGLAAQSDHDVERACSELRSAVTILQNAAPTEHKPNIKAAMEAELAKYRHNLAECRN